MLQNIVISAHGTYKATLAKDQKEALKVEHLLKYSKSLGKLSSDMVTITRTYGKLRKSARSKLLKKFNARVDKLQTQGELHMKTIESEINQI
jgi:uncharacterized membrane protein YvbJ